MNLIRTTTLFLCLFVSSCLTNPLLARQHEKNSEPALFYADSQTYDRELGILILKGNVEFEHEGNVLEADYVTYNANTDVVTASGNVRLRQASGEVDLAEYVELTGDMKNGVLLQIRTLMEDNSKLVAVEGRKCEDQEELDQAVYTPCLLCGDRPPTWQINARRVVKDNEAKDIHFTDAEFRILDVPIFYMPYTTQPLERRSGVLFPRPFYSSDFGAGVAAPYYFVLSDSADATLTPVIYSKQKPLLYGEYRKAFGRGIFNVQGSIAKYRLSDKDKEKKEEGLYSIPTTRGYIYGKTKINLDHIWRFEAGGGFVSDKTFFRKYTYTGWQNDPVFTSKAILEGFLNQRDYASARVYHFKGLKDKDDQSTIASPLPILDYSAYSGVDPLGGRFSFDGNLLNLYREQEGRMQRGIGVVGWRRQWLIPTGQLFTTFASTRGDLYKLKNYEMFDNGGARFFPQAGIDWRWPFANSTCLEQTLILQPVAQLRAAPEKAYGLKPGEIPNEDSADFAFNDANLFSQKRFPGYDLVDTGSRAVYGGELLTTGKLLGDVEAFLGQNYSISKPYRRSKDGNKEEDSKIKLLEEQGLDTRFSDLVGRIQATPHPWFSLQYQFRLDQKTLHQRIADVGAGFGPGLARLKVDYVFISRNAGTSTGKDFNQINLTLSSKFLKHWTLLTNVRKNLRKDTDDIGTLEKGIGLAYKDDCFGLTLNLKRQYYRSRDLEPATIFLVTLFLKNIGTYSHTFNLDNGILGEKKEDSAKLF